MINEVANLCGVSKSGWVAELMSSKFHFRFELPVIYDCWKTGKLYSTT